MSAVFIQQSIRLISLSVKRFRALAMARLGADSRRVREGESGGKGGIFMNFFINMSALSAQKRFLGEFGSGSRLYVDVVHAIQQGHKAVQVPLFGGWPVDCADEFLGVLRRDRLQLLRGLRRTRGRSGCGLECASTSAWKGGQHRDSGTSGLDSRGWRAGASAPNVARFGPAMRRMYTFSPIYMC